MSDIAVQQTVSENVATIKLVGKMSETADYSAVDISKALDAEFDFEGVTLINSKGIQIWKEFMKSLPDGIRFAYVRCPLKVVNQINLFPSFNGGKIVEIKSFFAPYFCETCDKSNSFLLQTATDFSTNGVTTPPARNCEDCRNQLVFDGNAQKYFLFLKRSF
jgi:hypothetical protein